MVQQQPAPKETYDRFMKRCETFFPHAVCVQLSIVYALAKHHHRHDVRKDERDEKGNPLRYFEHVRRVALLFFDEVHFPDLDIIMVALLHDAVEDTKLLPEAITLVCGAENSKRVMLMSKLVKDGFVDRLHEHADYKTLMVKVADRIDNLRSIKGSSATFIEKQVKETRAEYFDLAAAMVERTPEAYRDRAQRIERLLFAATIEAAGVAAAMVSR